MSLESWYRVSSYLTLGLSCCALVFAEAPFLPDLQICLAPVLALLLLGWWVEGRWSLPNRGADVLGLLIIASGVAWVLAHRTDPDLVLTQIPIYLALLPFMGPLLIAALLVKVFRAREPDEFWYLQGLGLTQVGLGCVLEGGPAFGAALAVYLVSVFVCLVLHYLHSVRSVREQKAGVTSTKLALIPQSPRPLDPSAGGGWWLFSFTLRWTLSIAAPALLLFLLTPRRDSWAWEPLNNFRSGSNRLRVNVGGENMNLNDTGRLELNDEVAFHVAAFDADGQPKWDLPPDQHWRSTVLDWYENGTWSMVQLQPLEGVPVDQIRWPEFGRDRFVLDFTVQLRHSGALVLAEPIRFGPRSARLPVLSLAGNGRERLFVERSGTLLPVEFSQPKAEYRYRQVVPTSGDPSRAPVGWFAKAESITDLTHLHPSLQGPLYAWTIDLLNRLAEDSRYRLPDGVRTALAEKRQRLKVGREEREATARALCDYLAHSGDFTYTLEITRHDRAVDPVLDFLLDVKKGHCELYAAALASMLRSLGIPARIVKGFRGWDSKGDGQYVIRHRHAHAWVEILVPRPAFAQGNRLQPFQGRPHDWLSLDPTPAGATTETPGISLDNMWEAVQRLSLQWWRSLIVDYNGDEQADLWNTLTSSRPPRVLLLFGFTALAFVAALAAWMLRRGHRVRALAASTGSLGGDAGIYGRLVRILRRHTSVRPAIGQTPREYGEEVQAVLQSTPGSAALSGWLMHVIELFYRVRFGAQPLREEEQQTLDREFDRFAKSEPEA